MTATLSPADRLTATAQSVRQRREAKAANRKFQRRAAIVAVVASPVLLLAGAVVNAALNPRSTATVMADDWRNKVGNANPFTLGEPKVEHKAVAAAPEPTAAEPKAETSTDRLGEWAAHQAEVQQAHEDKCWDQMETRGYGDPNCY
jgi:hypothetical protein